MVGSGAGTNAGFFHTLFFKIRSLYPYFLWNVSIEQALHQILASPIKSNFYFLAVFGNQQFPRFQKNYWYEYSTPSSTSFAGEHIW